MFLYFNSEHLNSQPDDYIKNLAKLLYENVYSIYEYTKKTKESGVNFWWDIDGDYFVFFGEEKKEVINYFLEMCMQRDGTKEEIKTKLKTIGYKIS